MRRRSTCLSLVTFTVLLVPSITTLLLTGLSIGNVSPGHLLGLSGLWLASVALTGAATINAFNFETITAQSEIRRLRATLDHATKENQQFWSTLSHELRTPLNSILGFSELLIDTDVVRDNASLWSDVAKVNYAGLELLTLVNDVLSLSGVDDETANPYPDRINLRELIDHVVAASTPLAERNNVEIELNVDSDPEIIRADAHKLERMLLALLTSALRSPQAGQIQISARPNHMDPPSIEIGLKFDVSMNPDYARLLATQYVERTATELAELGPASLSLAVVKKLMLELGGSISFDDTDENEVSAVLLIPVLRDDEARPEVKPQATSVPGVLIIDESDDSAELLARYLKRLGCRVNISNDGASGKEIAVLIQPDIIILDVDMDTIDGWAVFQHVRFDSHTREIPVVITSIKNVASKAFDRGAQDCMIKPISAADVERTIAKLQHFAYTAQTLATEAPDPGGATNRPLPDQG